MIGEYSNRLPYHLRAIYDWISDNGGIPNIGICVPTTKHLKGKLPKEMDGRKTAVINISKKHVRNLVIDGSGFKFSLDLYGLADHYKPGTFFEFNIPMLGILFLMDLYTKNGLKIQSNEYADPILINDEISRESIVIAQNIIDKITANVNKNQK